MKTTNEAMGNVVVIDRKYIPKIAHVRKVLKLKMGKDLSVYKTDSNNVYHKVSDSQIKRFLDRLDRFDVKYKLGESVNEGLNSKGFSIINQSMKTMAINFRDLQKLVKKQDDSRIWNEVDNIRYDLNRIEKVLKNKTYNESVNEAIEPSGIMAKINKIVQSKQAAKIDGVLMDMFSANIMMRIFNAVNDKSKKDMNKGTMRQVKVILHKVMKQNKVRESVSSRYKKLSDKEKVLVHLIDKGEKSSDAKKMVAKYYDKVSKMYKNANISKKAEIISTLSAKNEGSCGYGIDGKVGKEPAGIHLLKKIKKKVEEAGLPEKKAIIQYLQYIKKYKPDLYKGYQKSSKFKKYLKHLESKR